MNAATRACNHRGVLVANPGGISWMIHSAVAFAEHDELAAYCSPGAFAQSHLNTLDGRLPSRLIDPVLGQLRLRAVPEIVPAELVTRAATPTEIAYVLATRLHLPWPIISRLDYRQARAFDRGVSRSIKQRLSAVIGYQGTTVRTFEAARRSGVARILDYPIAHYEICQEVLREEIRLVPAYAGTMQGHEIERWRKRRYAREIEMADRIIMLSTIHRRSFEDAGIPSEQLFIAPLGVDLDLFTPADDRDEKTFRVLFCGQITQRKGISYLVDAFKRAELADAELVFVGHPVGGPHPWIDEPRARHLPARPRPQLADVYRSADVIVLPSLIEGFGATPLEAMACGVPAIVSENTFAHDVIEQGVDGWVTPIRDPEAIAGHLCALYEDRNRNWVMGQAARRKAEQFPWSRYRESLRAGVQNAVRPSGDPHS